MANCRVTNPITNVCGDLLQASGVDKDFWVGYVSDLSVRFPLTMLAPISSIQFIPYNGLKKFEGQKYAHKFDKAGNVAPGGNISLSHKGMIKLKALSTQDDLSLLQLMQAQDMFVIIQDNNESLFIYAPSKGFSYVAGDIGTTGQAAGEDTADTLNFIGNEKVPPLRFTLGGTIDADLAYLNSLIR